VTSIESGAFKQNWLTVVKIPGSVTSIGNDAFRQNYLTKVKIPDSVNSIGKDAFTSNNLTEVTLPAHFEDDPPTDAFDSCVKFVYTDPVIPEQEDYKRPNTNKTISGTNKNDDLNGTSKNDLITGKKGNDKLNGSKGDDVLTGNDGNDILKGSKGEDYLDGSAGGDILFGGKHADVFQISKGIDLIADFSIKQGDRIALDSTGKYKIIEDNDGVVIKASSKNQLLLEGVTYDDVIAAGLALFVQPV